MLSLGPVSKRKDVNFKCWCFVSGPPARFILNVFILCRTTAASPGHAGWRIHFSRPAQPCWLVWLLLDTGIGDNYQEGEEVLRLVFPTLRFVCVLSLLNYHVSPGTS